MNRELLIDKYRPKSFDEMIYSTDVNAFLAAVAQKTDMPHLIIEGPRGCGKRLRVELYLRKKYGEFRTNSGIINLDVPGKNDTKPVHTLYSKYHHQFNPSIHNIYDRSLMQCFTSEIVQTRMVIDIPYRIIIVEDADRLSVEAQESLRRTLETCVSNCRFIFLVNNEDRMIAPIYSRCITVKVAAPTINEMITIMRDICTKEGLNYPDTVLERIANASGRNLHKALNTLNKFMLNNCKVFDRMDYDDIYRYCTEIIDTMIKGQTIAGSIDAVRLLLYELVNYCVDCITLLPVLLEIAIHRLPETAHNERFELVKIASERDKSIRNSSKDIYHIESFCLHVFRIVKVLMLTKQRRTPKIKVKGVDAT